MVLDTLEQESPTWSSERGSITISVLSVLFVWSFQTGSLYIVLTAVELTMEAMLNSNIQRPTCLWSADIKSVGHHIQLLFSC